MITETSNKKNPIWYKDAIIYQLHVRAFYDSNDDGIGDFQGLIQKLDYLVGLGITAIWLLPFYPSPLKDDGYDIADYNNINPAYGTLEDFQEFLKQAHARDIRVITELVINHTSDQHEWFQKSRHAPPDSYWRNFYVWSDNPQKYKSARIIFKDFEMSNWTWDPLAKSYYWHRFYSHQPDLNFDNPEVQNAVFKALDFWMEMGVDGLRLDAVPYLFERENTSCENLPETHAFLKKLRAYIDQKYPGRMLLAEANQWPEDVVNYFGNGDECHMNFHFPLMPRLFMALKMEDRYSIVDILKQTPEIPANCQWAIFLRNHDEMTLEMVTDEERDYMYKVYAHDPRARINLGVRRRLAPLAGNDRRQIELLNILLFSLPGSPIIYYGDEIGMGDNIYLGDRDGVRTPFQWSLDRNAGFSRANSQKLYLPLVTTPEYAAEAINVENLRANPTSLLWWMSKLISLRSANPVLSRGTFEVINSTNPKVLSYVRAYQGQSMICVVNLSRHAQYVELDLSRFKGLAPVELFGQTDFPKIGENGYVLTLAPYAFYWLLVQEKQSADQTAIMSDPKSLVLDEDPLENLRHRQVWNPFSRALKEYLLRARWFAGKGRRISAVVLEDSIEIPTPEKAGRGRLVIFKVYYYEGLPESYLIGLGHAYGDAAKKILEHPAMMIAETQGAQGEHGILYDALMEGTFCQSLLEMIEQRKKVPGSFGKVVSEFQDVPALPLPAPVFRHLEQSNSSVDFGEQYHMKFYRRLEEGENPEVEVGRYFQRKNFKDTASFVGTLSYSQNSINSSLAVIHKMVPFESDGWTLMFNKIGQIAEKMLTEPIAEIWPDKPPLTISRLAEFNPPPEYQELIGYTLVLAKQIGAKTAAMHLCLGAEDRDPAFVPEAFTPFQQRSLFQSFRNLADRAITQLLSDVGQLDPVSKEMAQAVLDSQDKIRDCFARIKETPLHALRTRVHGDYHLGQLLFTGQDFVIIDFEGEPARSFGERKLKGNPLRDVAGMIRSFEYAAEFYLKKFVVKDQDRDKLRPHLQVWARWASLDFLKSYLAAMGESELLPKDPQEMEDLLKAFLMEKALYEISYELRNRREWVGIPLRGVLDLLLTPKKRAS